MKKQLRWLLIIILILGMATLACSTLGGGDEPESAAPMSDPTTVPPAPPVDDSGGAGAGADDGDPGQPADDGGDETPDDDASGGDEQPPDNPAPAGGDTLNLEDPGLYNAYSTLNSYAINWLFTFNGTADDGSPVAGEVFLDGVYSAEPGEMSQVFSSSGNAVLGESEIFTIVYKDGVQYIVAPEFGCMTSTTDDPDVPFGMDGSSIDFLVGEAVRVMPDETINGIDVYVYQFTEANVIPSEMGGDVVELTEGFIKIAKDTGFLVQLRMLGQGTADVLSGDLNLVGDITYEMTLSDFNQPISATVPPECTEEPGSDDFSYPMPDDASEVSSFPGVTTFMTEMAMADAVAFYKAEMAAAGWTLTEEYTQEGFLASITFTKDGGTIIVTMTPDPDSGKVMVVILEEE